MKLSEAALQTHTRVILAGLGYPSMETGSTRKMVTCPTCTAQFHPTGWQGNTIGAPDLLVYRDRSSFPPVAALLELKTATGAIRPAQKALIDAGRVQVARSVKDAVEAILRVESAMDAYRFDPERHALLCRFLTENEGRI